MKDFFAGRDRSFLMRRMGSMSQLAGLRRCILADGKATGVEAVDVKTGSGLEFTVLPGRGMDIAWANYKGVPLSYMSKTGVTAPGYYESEGDRWLRSFFGGLLTTCGLSNVGPACEGPSGKHGLHGRIANTGAENVCVSEGWEGGSYVMSVSGRLREAAVFGENLTLTRNITAVLGERRFTLTDVVENHACEPYPLMLLYHFNIGYPILDGKSKLICNSRVMPRDEDAAQHVDEYARMHKPRKGQSEEVFFHDLRADGDGMVKAALVNHDLELGVYLKFDKRELNYFTEWKMLSEGEYVLGMEPGNCNPVSLARQIAEGEAEMLSPGEKRSFHIEFGVLDGERKIAGFVRENG